MGSSNLHDKLLEQIPNTHRISIRRQDALGTCQNWMVLHIRESVKNILGNADLVVKRDIGRYDRFVPKKRLILSEREFRHTDIIKILWTWGLEVNFWLDSLSLGSLRCFCHFTGCAHLLLLLASFIVCLIVYLSVCCDCYLATGKNASDPVCLDC